MAVKNLKNKMNFSNVTNSNTQVNIITGLAGVRGQLGLLISYSSACIEFILAAPGDGAVLCGVVG